MGAAGSRLGDPRALRCARGRVGERAKASRLMTPVETAKRIGRGTRNRENWIQLVQFGMVGLSGYFVNLAVFAALATGLEIHHIPAAVGAFCVAVTNNFWWN